MTNEQLVMLCKQGDRNAAAVLWTRTHRLIHKLMSKYLPLCRSCNCEPEDLLQSGYLAMLRAVQAYDPDKGFAFTTYLTHHVANTARETLSFTGSGYAAMPPHVRSLSEPVTEDGDVELADTIVDPDATEPFERVIDGVFNAQLHETLEECLSRIPQDEADTLRARYYDGRSLADIASKHGNRIERIRRSDARGLCALRHGVNREQLMQYHEHISSHPNT